MFYKKKFFFFSLSFITFSFLLSVLHQSAATNGLNNSGNISEDSNTQDSILGLSSVPKSTTTITTSTPITTLSNSVNNTIPAPISVSITTNTTSSTTSNNNNNNNNISNNISNNININHVVRGGRKLSHLHETPAKRKARLKDVSI